MTGPAQPPHVADPVVDPVNGPGTRSAWADELAFAVATAEAAGVVLMDHYEQLERIDRKSARDVVTEADHLSEGLVIAAIRARFPTAPPGFVVLGPAPVQERDVAAFLDQSNVLGMLRYVYGQDVRGGIAYSVADFERFSAEERFDIRPLSRLDADVDLSSDHQGVPVTGGS